MKTTNNKPSIVKLMREIRDKISIDISEMSLEQEKSFIKIQLSELKKKNYRQHQQPI